MSSLRERVIEYCLEDPGSDLLVRKTVSDFVLSVGDRTPAPGGGSVSALVAAMGCALAAMVSKLVSDCRDFDIRKLVWFLNNIYILV